MTVRTMAALPEGVRASVPVVLPTVAVGVSFGLLAQPRFGVIATVAMSMLVWSGTAQFAVLSVLGGGGSAAVATGTGLLANARYLPMGFAVAPSMAGPWWRRLLTGTLLADASFVIGNRGAGRFDVAAVAWAAPLQYAAWNGGTLVGALGAGLVTDPSAFGLDVLFPVFYLGLLLPELRRRDASGLRARPVLAAAVAAAISLALTPFTPAGVPIVVAAAAALIGLVPPRDAGGHP